MKTEVTPQILKKLMTEGRIFIDRGKKEEATDALNTILVLLSEATLRGESKIGSMDIDSFKIKTWNLLEKHELLM